MPILHESKIISALSALDAAAAIPSIEYAERVEVDVHFGAATTAGTVVIESAHDSAFTGIWHIEATIAWAVVANKSYHASVVGPRRALRARISVGVVAGTVDVYVKVAR